MYFQQVAIVLRYDNQNKIYFDRFLPI